MAFIPKTIFISGASGFVASNLIQKLANDFMVIGSSRKLNIKFPNQVKILTGNFYDQEFINQLKRHTVDTIIHCAAIRGQTALPDEEYQKVNVRGTEALLKYASENRNSRFIYLSTVGVLGTVPNPQPASSANKPNPDNTYHRSKWQAEQLVRQYHSEHLKTIILRPTITYGQGDNGFMVKLQKLVLSKRLVFPKKDIMIHLLNVQALVELINHIIREDLFDGNCYLIADHKPLLLKQLVDAVSNNIHGSAYPRYLQIPDYTFNLAKQITRFLGHKQILTSLQLISDNWTYDISNTIKNLGYQPADTLESIRSSYK